MLFFGGVVGARSICVLCFETGRLQMNPSHGVFQLTKAFKLHVFANRFILLSAHLFFLSVPLSTPQVLRRHNLLHSQDPSLPPQPSLPHHPRPLPRPLQRLGYQLPHQSLSKPPHRRGIHRRAVQDSPNVSAICRDGRWYRWGRK